MSPEAVAQLFSGSKSGTHPFGRVSGALVRAGLTPHAHSARGLIDTSCMLLLQLFPDIVRHNDEGGVSLATWLHLWR